jgi:mono/diheme cytochrome c family protein
MRLSGTVYLLVFVSLCAAQGLYEQHIRPVLEKHCVNCHNATLKQAGLDLSSREKIMRGGDRGAAVVPGSLDESLLYAYITHRRQPGMPFGGKQLAPDVIAKFAEWIKAGAAFELPRAASAVSSHWAFRKPEKATIPRVQSAEWSRNPVDAFLAAEHETRGLRPLGEADRYTLIRRVYLDLIGLPPAPLQVEAFINDRTPNAYEKVVEELLASKHYGERWGRHWMDIWRYSDWYGSGTAEVRSSHRHIWRWRDWIIDSLNDDKGYARMIEEMLAGDEIAPADPKVLPATGFLARNWFRFNRNVWLVDTVESTTTAFLGVTLKCARCHDHKYDPFPQTDYYRFRAFFEPHDVRIDRVEGQPDRKKAGLPRAYDSEAKEAGPDLEGGINLMPPIFGKTYLFVRGDENNPDRDQEMLPGTPAVLGGPEVRIAPVELPVESYYSDIRPFVAKDLVEEAQANVKAVEEKLAKLRAALEEARREAAAPAKDVPGLPVDFAKEVKPILEARCAACHQGRNSKGGLSLSSEQTIKAGGKSGPAVVAGKSSESLLIQFLKGDRQPRMPFNGPALEESSVALIARWIDRLPRKTPIEIVKENPFLISAAEKELVSAKAAVVALQARIRAEHAKYAKTPSVDYEKLADETKAAEREANLLKAGENVFRAQQRLTEAMSGPVPREEEERKVRDRNLASAKRDLEVALAALNKPADAYSPLGPIHPKMSTGRRLALARWITSAGNPLTARVAVNHVWLRHFGKPLVPNVTDFGRNGKPPTHPALLDWLAVEFMNSGWSMKKLHRLMVTSRAYRMESRLLSAEHANETIDRDNLYLWRMNTRRLEAEVIRDSVLQVSGALDRTMGGPELHEETEQDSPRRSIYFHITPSAQLQFLKVFDGADPTACYVRSESIVPQQALALANSKLSLEHARLLAGHLGGLSNPSGEFVRAAFLTVLGRPASGVEEQKSVAYLERHAALAKEVGAGSDPPDLRARQSLIHALFNRDEFVNIR